MEGKNAVAYDHLPSVTPPTTIIRLLIICFRFLNLLLNVLDCLNVFEFRSLKNNFTQFQFTTIPLVDLFMSRIKNVHVTMVSVQK